MIAGPADSGGVPPVVSLSATTGGVVAGVNSGSITTHVHSPLPRWTPDQGRRVLGPVPPEPPALISRPELAEIGGAFTAGARIVVVHGGRGHGKTSLAALHIRSVMTAPDGPILVVWVTAETADQAIAGLAFAARDLALADPTVPDQAAAEALRNALTALDEPALLILDNAENPVDLRRWLPAGTCQVLITTTNTQFTQYGTAIPVGTYTRGQSLTYLGSVTRLGDLAVAAEVADALGDHPLALALAAHTISARQWDYPRYLTAHRTRPLSSTLPAGTLAGYPTGYADALALSIAVAREAHPRTEQVMDILAVLDPTSISRALLAVLVAHPDHPVDDDTLDEVLAVLAGAALITLTPTEVTLHRLVARALAERLPRGVLTNRLASAMTAVTALAALGGIHLGDLPTGYPEQIGLHALAIHGHATTRGIANDAQIAITHQALTVNDFLYAASAYGSLVVLAQATSTACAALLGESHDDTLLSHNQLAHGYLCSGRISDALTLLQGIVDARDTDHPEFLEARDNLGLAYLQAGRPDDAIPLLEESHKRRERDLSHDHPNILQSRHNLGEAYRVAGNHVKAIPLLEVNLAARERALPAGDPVIASSLSCLGASYAASGRAVDAIPLLERALSIREHVLPPGHADTLTTRQDLANAYLITERDADAVAQSEASLAAREARLGPDHPWTLDSRENLARAYISVGRTSDGVALLAEATLRRRALALTHLHEGRHADAIALLTANVRTLDSILGSDDPLALDAGNDLGNAYRAAAHLDQAIDCYKRTLQTRWENLGPTDPDTLISCYNLAAAYHEAGKVAQAYLAIVPMIPSIEGILGPDHPVTLAARRFSDDWQAMAARWQTWRR